MSDLSTILDTLLPIVGETVIKKAEAELADLATDASDPTKAMVFSLMADAVTELGPDGVKVAKQEINRLLRGEDADIDWASPITASDAVAMLQNAERAKRKTAREAARKAGKLIGTFGAILFKAAVVSALG